MARAHYERLSALDASMVFMETPHTHMHIGEVGIMDAGPLTRSDGGIDIERIRAHVDGALDALPRQRQRLAFVPVERHPVWVDDARFKLDYHVRCVSLPHPGTERQLKRLVGTIMSQKLDVSKPLWELWILEGLEGGRFAMVNKLHHCMVDGISAVNILSAYFSPDPKAAAHRPTPWRPRPAPSPTRLARTSCDGWPGPRRHSPAASPRRWNIPRKRSTRSATRPQAPSKRCPTSYRPRRPRRSTWTNSGRTGASIGCGSTSTPSRT